MADENRKIETGGFSGISLADGRAIYGSENSQSPSEERSGGASVYLDAINDTEDEIAELEKNKKNSFTPKDKRSISILAALDFAVFAAIGIFLILTGGGDPYESLREESEFNPETDYYNVSSVFDGELSPYIKGVDFPSGIQESFKPLYSENDDTVGWIKIDGTSIDFPVLKAGDNTYYSRKNFYGEYDRRGSIWLDSRCRVGKGASSLSKNTIVYGHNLTEDECIFRDVTKYTDVEYYKTHPVIEMDTLYDNFKWKVFACFITTVEEQYDGGSVFYYIDPTVPDDRTEDFVNECLTRSYFVNPAVDIQSSDKLLCLSTCTYDLNKTEYIETRCVLMARLVRNGESEEVDVSGAYANENRRMPQLWYDQNGLQNPYAGVPVFSR